MVRQGKEEAHVSEHQRRRGLALIAQLNGIVARTGPSWVIIDVGGVGYKVNVPLSVLESLPKVGEKTLLVTHMLVREDDLSLYGFLEDTELKVFELLLTVSGVGPKVALAMLSALSGEDLARAVGSEDVRTLTRVPGVGARTAQRIVLELREKLQALGFETRVQALASQDKVRLEGGASTVAEDVVSALVNLGYNKNEAQRATDTAMKEKLKTSSTVEFTGLFRAALNQLTGQI
jgi:holliday junction DNA helicase RuvA